MNARVRDTLVGLTAIAGAVGLAMMLMLFGEFRTTATYPILVRMDTAGGLSKVSAVMLNGVRVGSVRRIRTAEDPRDGVVLDLAIREGVTIPGDVRIAIDRTFVGDASLGLLTRAPGDPKARPDAPALRPGDRIEGQATSLLSEVSGLLDERLKSLDTAVESFNTLSTTYTRVGERVERLLEPRDPEAVARGEQEANVASAIARVDRAAAALEAWAGDEEMRADVKHAASRAATLFDQASEAVETWTATARTIDEQAQALGANATQAARDLGLMTASVGEAVQDVRVAVAKINDGEGTVGMLLNNPDLYNSLTDAARRLEKALTEAQLLIEKYRKEGIPIQW